MTVIVAPPQVTGQANEDWQELQAETADAPAFEPGQADRLPWPARRWVLHAIEPGTPLLRSVALVTRAQIRLGRWRRFDAVQVLSPMRGFRLGGQNLAGTGASTGLRPQLRGSGGDAEAGARNLPGNVRFGAGHHRERGWAVGVRVRSGACRGARSARPVDGCRRPRVIASLPAGDEDYDVTLNVDPLGVLARVTVER
ncbi:hypothetical protein [Nonomuraea sp. NPDC003214]